MRGEMREGGGREEGDEGEEGGEEGGTYSGGHRSSLFHSSWPLNVSLSEQPLRLFNVKEVFGVRRSLQVRNF